MKYLIALFLGLVLLAGCLTEPAKPAVVTKEEFAKQVNISTAPVQEQIFVSGNETNAIIKINAVQNGSKWLFPMKDYENQFVNVGFYSTAFIKLNRTQVAWLDNDESIWFTVMRGNGSGVLFNAIYSKEVSKCGADGFVEILGLYYPIDTLKNGSSFAGDDKWKVAIDSERGCAKRVIVYLDGYIDGLKDGEQLNLFRNDNTMLLSFHDLQTKPSLQVMANKPFVNTTKVQENKEPKESLSAVNDDYAGKEYNQTEIVNSSGTYLTFEPALPVYTGYFTDSSDYRTDNHHVFLTVAGRKYVITCLDYNETADHSNFCLGKEEEYEMLNPNSCRPENNSQKDEYGNVYYMNISGKIYAFDDFELNNYGYGADARIVTENADCSIVQQNETGCYRIRQGASHQLPQGGSLHVWSMASGYTFCAKWVGISYLSKETILAAGKDGVQMQWEMQGQPEEVLTVVDGEIVRKMEIKEYNIPALKSVFIPAGVLEGN